jgi:ribokinase
MGLAPRLGGVVVVGSLNRDYVVEAPARPEPGETVTGARLSLASGGKGANQAAAAARLGAAVSLLGKVGDDADGRSLIAALHDAGVDTRGVALSPSAPTGAAFITVTPDGENAIVVASGANALLHRDDLAERSEILRNAQVLLLQLEVPVDAVEAAVQLAGGQTLVILNAAPYRHLDPTALERVDVLVVNAVEARQLLGRDVMLEDPEQFVELGPRATVVTLGAAGSRAFVEHHVFEQEALHRHVVDTTGAGDAFVGALGAWLAREEVSRSDALSKPLCRALTGASAAAAYSIERLGAQPSYGTTVEIGAPWT